MNSSPDQLLTSKSDTLYVLTGFSSFMVLGSTLVFLPVIFNSSINASVQTVAMIVDPDASVSVLPQGIYKEHFRTAPLHQSSVRLVTYSKTPINVLGCMQATVHMNGIKSPARFYVVESGNALMGRDLISSLHLHIEGNNVYLPSSLPSCPSPSVSVGYLTTQSTSSAILGCAMGFMHKVKLSPAAVPVRQKLRSLPLSVQTAVSNQLNRLLSAGVIERIDASPWVSPIVVTQKNTGRIRMCADLRKPNKAIIVDSHPLPHKKELLASLAGATVFSTVDLKKAYYQVPLHPDSRDLTAFITHEGLFRFCRVPLWPFVSSCSISKDDDDSLEGCT